MKKMSFWVKLAAGLALLPLIVLAEMLSLTGIGSALSAQNDILVLIGITGISTWGFLHIIGLGLLIKFIIKKNKQSHA